MSSPLDPLCTRITDVHLAMTEAFAARLDGLRRMGGPLPTLSHAVIDTWMHDVIAAWRVPLDDPAIVPALAALVEHGRTCGLDGAGQRAGMEALVWACRDVLPDACPPAFTAEVSARAAIIDHLMARHTRSATPSPETPADA